MSKTSPDDRSASSFLIRGDALRIVRSSLTLCSILDLSEMTQDLVQTWQCLLCDGTKVHVIDVVVAGYTSFHCFTDSGVRELERTAV